MQNSWVFHHRVITNRRPRAWWTFRLVEIRDGGGGRRGNINLVCRHCIWYLQTPSDNSPFCITRQCCHL